MSFFSIPFETAQAHTELAARSRAADGLQQRDQYRHVLSTGDHPLAGALPVLGICQDSYGLDGTILGLPGGKVRREIVRSPERQFLAGGIDQPVFCLPDPSAWQQIMARFELRAWTRLPRSSTGRTTAALPAATQTDVKSCSHRGSAGHPARSRFRALAEPPGDILRLAPVPGDGGGHDCGALGSSW